MVIIGRCQSAVFQLSRWVADTILLVIISRYIGKCVSKWVVQVTEQILKLVLGMVSLTQVKYLQLSPIWCISLSAEQKLSDRHPLELGTVLAYVVEYAVYFPSVLHHSISVLHLELLLSYPCKVVQIIISLKYTFRCRVLNLVQNLWYKHVQQRLTKLENNKWVEEGYMAALCSAGSIAPLTTQDTHKKASVRFWSAALLSTSETAMCTASHFWKQLAPGPIINTAQWTRRNCRCCFR